jgi:hypothetical protein
MNCQHCDSPMIEDTPLNVDMFFDNKDATTRYFATDQVEAICSTCLRNGIWMKMVLR